MNFWNSILPCVLLVLFDQAIQSESQLILKDGAPVALTSDGPIRGKIVQSRNSRSYYAFRGILYAKQRRFQVAETIPWSAEIRDAYEFGSICPQVSLHDGALNTASEDCLFLNTYVPVTPETGSNKPKLLPVMLWIHGGGFMDGAGSNMGADYFMDEDVILVTFNYRLGALGFLNTGDGVIPSNLGLKDMVLALKWVQRNIPGFGGDPNKVTIFGESAGGNAVHLLMLSPAAKGLFRGAISQSGTALSPWSLAVNPEKKAKTVAESLGCSTENSAALAKCLLTKDTESILIAQRGVTHSRDDAIEVAFSPSIESKLPRFRLEKEDFIFMPASPYELVVDKTHDNSRDVPFIIGGNDMEGLVIFAIGFLTSEDKMKSLNDNFMDETSKTFAYGSYVPAEELDKFSNELKNIYYGEESLRMDNGHILTQLHGDLNFFRGIKLAANLHSETNSQVYPYILKYQGEFSISNLLGLPTQGVTHADDLQYLFPSIKEPKNWPDLKPNSTDEEFSKKLVSLWASFAINGKPSTSWVDTWLPVSRSTTERGTESELQRMSWLHLESSPILVKEAEDSWARMNKVNALFSKYEKPQISRQAGAGVSADVKTLRNEL